MCSSLDSLTLKIPTHWTCTDLCEMKQRRGMSEVCEQEGTGEEARGHSAKAQVTCCFQRRCYQSRRGNMHTQRIWSDWGMHVHRKKKQDEILYLRRVPENQWQVTLRDIARRQKLPHPASPRLPMDPFPSTLPPHPANFLHLFNTVCWAPIVHAKHAARNLDPASKKPFI